MEPRVGVIILTYNRKEVLKSCLLSLLKAKYQNFVVIVVDNASTDGTSDMIKSQFPFVKFIRSETNLGYTGGNNLGIIYALGNEDCKYLLILNDDTFVDSNLISELVDVAERDARIGVANPKIVEFENPAKLCQMYGKYNFYLGIHYRSLMKINEPREISLLRGTCFLIRKEVIEKIGLMDENFFLYFDEADLSYRVKKAMYKIMYVPTAKVYHRVSSSFSGKMNPIVLYYGTRNELLFARKHLNPMIFFPLWIPRFVFRIFKYSIKTRDITVVKAILDGFIDFTKNRYGNVSAQAA